MPRLPPSLLRRAHRTSPHLAALLPACRTLASARNELRWIREHVANTLPSSPHGREARLVGLANARKRESLLLTDLCRKRGRGYPLQYVLGTQPFGDLEIKCRPGVLIPRPETEAWVTRLAEVVRASGDGYGVAGRGDDEGPRVLDLCTGSGCVALLLYSLLHRRFPGMGVRGVDVEPKAIALARENWAFNVRLGVLPRGERDVAFEEADIFSAEWMSSLRLSRDGDEVEGGERVDILVANPPYISSRGFNRDTERSVRRYEPKLALVPTPPTSLQLPMGCQPEDVFYTRILDVAKLLQPRFTVLEVGDLAQGLRVVKMTRSRFDGVEIEVWRDWPDMKPDENEPDSVKVDGVEVPVRGSGHGRAVFIRRTF
ncbi:S-adenosyl-L-methionine-dependent methyltransferase [Annulohypoxylon truncatum]|uniref:S-adenosyl-L-methionine-dependent methyltransferase n=1 Tax=Annulohypoxylon truncatum TaxID=327061 RepID=UPI00200823E2|nr:S-adenosyl-L-methionine-dependent methyltransferase [Annulohypoxylon truncatum]KAI1214676.1 S-adenosyl-L-methionine-dependent methyltransferase [Annulohypoxylon truncatum]